MKNVIITGSTRGIGYCMAMEFLKFGCNITISGRGNEMPENIEKLMIKYENNILYIPCNVTSFN